MKIYGKNVSKERLMSDERINKIYLSKNFKDNDIINLIKKKKVKTKYLSSNELDRLTDNSLHQGIVMEIDEVKTFDISILKKINKDFPLVVMLDHLEDPHNFGAIIRTSEALGIDAIIIPNDRSVNITSTVFKTSVGAIENIKIIRVANLSNAIEKLKSYGFWIVGTDMVGKSYYDLDYKMPICLVIGNEGKGMSKIIKDNCDFIASIPMSGKVNSLNASVSCGIILSEIVKQRK